MKVGLIGLGKLGLPVALAINSKGHEVCGYDINQDVQKYLDERAIPFREEGSQELLDTHTVEFKTLGGVIESSEIIFVSVQTPHDPRFEGITRIPKERDDFDYQYLQKVMTDISNHLDEHVQEDRIVIVISTVLPTTMEKYVLPTMSKRIKLCYNPFFIAMGTTINDFLNPEFVLFGVDDLEAASKAEEFYRTLHSRPFYRTTIRNAEMIKVCYNTYISMKIAYANTVMEMCDKLNANCDEVIGAIKLSDQRLMSGKYLNGGMGDGGGCHPRDNIAMSWLSNKLEMSHNLFDDIMMAREHQTEWLADRAISLSKGSGLPIIILGKAFKEQTNLVSGSPAILLKNLIEEKLGTYTTQIYDPYIKSEPLSEYAKLSGVKDFSFIPAVYFIATKHDVFKTYKFPAGSIVLDVWRYLDVQQDGVTYLPIGGYKP